MTIASTCSTSICCTILICAAVSVSSLMPLEISVYFAGARLLVGLRAVLHRLEELVGERLHHQRDFRLVGSLSEGRRHRQDRNGEEGGAGYDGATARRLEMANHCCLRVAHSLDCEPLSRVICRNALLASAGKSLYGSSRDIRQAWQKQSYPRELGYAMPNFKTLRFKNGTRRLGRPADSGGDRARRHDALGRRGL
jgi:hypothetical protein